MKKRFNKGIAGPVELAIVAVVLAAVGFVGYRVYQARQDDQANSQSSQEEVAELPENLDGVITLDKLKEVAAAEKAGAAITGIELENEDEQLVFKVELSDGTVLYINATTGAVTKTGSTDDDDDGDDLPANFVASVSFAKARQLAQDKFPEKKLSKIQLENEDGQVVYRVRFTDETRLDVNATTGKISDVRLGEDDGDDDDETDNKRGRSSDDDDDKDEDEDSDDNSGRGGSDDDDDRSGSNSGSSDDDEDDSEDEDEDEDEEEDDNDADEDDEDEDEPEDD